MTTASMGGLTTNLKMGLADISIGELYLPVRRQLFMSSRSGLPMICMVGLSMFRQGVSALFSRGGLIVPCGRWGRSLGEWGSIRVQNMWNGLDMCQWITLGVACGEYIGRFMIISICISLRSIG